MKILATLFLAAACTFSAAAQQTNEKQILIDLLNEFLTGAGENTAEVHERFWAEDLIYTRASGQRTGKAEIMKSVRSTPRPASNAPKTVYSADNVQINIYGDTAVVAFKLVGKTTSKDGSIETSTFYNTGTFVKREKRWQAVAWQATAIPKTPEK